MKCTVWNLESESCNIASVMVISWNLILMPSWVLGKERRHTCNFWFLCGRSWRSQHVLTQFFFSSQTRTIDCFQNALNLPKLNSHMFITSQIVIYLFSRIIYFTHPIFLSVLFIDDHPEHLLPSAEVTPLLKMGSHPKTCSTCCVLPKVNFQYFGSSTFFPHFKTCCSLKSAIL